MCLEDTTHLCLPLSVYWTLKYPTCREVSPTTVGLTNECLASIVYILVVIDVGTLLDMLLYVQSIIPWHSVLALC